MAFFIYNPLTKKKEEFKPLEKGKVKMYVCGPTVYDYASIGNMWSYLTADILRRYLEYLGYEVRQIRNITDVGHFTDDEELEVKGEDKMEKAARREKKRPLELAAHYIKYYERDMKKLNILAAHYEPRPTKEIEEIIKIVGELLKKGFAYETGDGVYFSAKKFKDYGKLSGNTLDQIQAGARVEVNENKKHPADFALWIKRVGKNKRHSLFWGSPWGPGFPGWHIECTAMATKYLGDSLDVHTGGEDNIFPHHECEIAQSEAYTGKPFVKYWVHTRHFYIEGEKMSKSLGNVFTVSPTPDKRYESLEERGYPPLVFRTLKLGSHYRSKANFTWQGMDQAKRNWEKINEFYTKVSNYVERKQNPGATEASKLETDEFLKKFKEALDDDLNTPLALSVVLELVKKGNEMLDEKKEELKNPGEVKKLLENFDKVLAILEKEAGGKKKLAVPAEIKKLAQERAEARKAKDFEKADRLREKIEAAGFEIMDKGEGFEIKRKG